jgi:hypothetical protein
MIKIKNIHSVVDLITNSSTTIYTQAKKGSIETVKEIINIILKTSESGQTADDLYTFDIKAKIDYVYFDEWFAEKLTDFYDKPSIQTKFHELANEFGYDERDKHFQKYLDSIGVNLEQYFLESDEENDYNSYLEISPKPGVTSPDNLGELLNKLFTYHESFEG